MKEYFSHDYNARNDEKVISLMTDFGYEGYGLFWAIVEMLYQNNGYLMRSNYKRIAYALHADSERIATIIENYGLFKSDGDRFYSESVLERIEIRELTKKNAKKAANARWNADAMHAHCDGNAIKEKEKKERNKESDFYFFWEDFHEKTKQKKKMIQMCERLHFQLSNEKKKIAIESIPDNPVDVVEYLKGIRDGKD